MTEMERLAKIAAKAEARDAVAMALAVGIATAMNIIVLGVLYDAIVNSEGGGVGLSENATQLLTMGLGGIIGVLGSYIGGRNAQTAAQTAGEQAVAQVQALPLPSGQDGPQSVPEGSNP